jgi:hypothetical protein
MTTSYEYTLTVEVPDDYYPPDAGTLQSVLAERFGDVHSSVSFEVEEVER